MSNKLTDRLIALGHHRPIAIGRHKPIAIGRHRPIAIGRHSVWVVIRLNTTGIITTVN